MTCTLIESYLYVRILMKENSRKGKRNTGAGDDACPECLYGLCVWIWGIKALSYIFRRCHSSVRLQISLQLRHFFRQESGKVNRPVRIQMVRIAKVFQIGLKSLVMGVIIIAHAIFQRNLV